MKIGFSPIEEIIYARDYAAFTKSTIKVTTSFISKDIRRLRAIAILEQKDPEKLYPIEKSMQEYFLSTFKTKGIK